uniref:Helix-turn-helix domain-containing protein n=1 Tax=Bosea sp. NBC_00436 TaxID=2969620 RepID=A0A9E7ZIV1_9HYPH
MSSLENALKILSLLNRDRPVLRVGEVCRELDMPKSSVSRLLKTLSDYGLVEREARDLGYVAGRRALTLADLHLANRSLLELIDAALDSLVSEFKFVGYAAVLSGSDITILRVKNGTHPLRLVHEVGRQMPALPTTVGVALLARETDAAVGAILADELKAAADRRQILDSISAARKTGSVSFVRPGISALGVAIHDPSRNEKIAFSICYPANAVGEQLFARMQERICQEAHRIGTRVGDPYWSSRNADSAGAPAAPPSKSPAKEPAEMAGL